MDPAAGHPQPSRRRTPALPAVVPCGDVDGDPADVAVAETRGAPIGSQMALTGSTDLVAVVAVGADGVLPMHLVEDRAAE
jgi:hypothetical protein